MRIFKPALKVFLTLTIFFTMDAVMSFALIPYGSRSEVTWSDYRVQDSIDTVIVGTSLGERAFDPAVLDAECGSKSFNLCTPSQSIEESIMAVEKAMDDHDIKRVIFAFDMNVAEDSHFPAPNSAFILNKDRGDIPSYFRDALFCLTDSRCYTTSDSLNWIFPWVKNHVKLMPSNVVANVSMKCQGVSLEEAANVNGNGWIYYGSGYGNFSQTIDKNKGKTSTYSSISGKKDLDSRKLESLERLCDLCTANGVELTVVFMPWPAYSVFDYGEQYFEKTGQIESLVEDCDQTYFNLEFAKPELFDVSGDDIFADNQHMNDAGAQEASAALGRLIAMQKMGQDTDSLFRTKSEFDSEMAYVDMVKLTAKVQGNQVDLKAKALAGSKAKVEYRYFVKADGAKDWEPISDWTTDREIRYQSDEPGKRVFRVNARLIGSDAHWERYREVKATIK